MASSLGYALMSWSTEFARHTKTKIDRKREKRQQRKSAKVQQQQSTSGAHVSPAATSEIGEFDIVDYNRITTERFPSMTRQIEAAAAQVQSYDIEAQTEAMHCDRCLELSDEIGHLVSQLTDVELIQEDLRRKLSITKTNLATSIERETSLRDTNESLTLDEAQLRYELDNLKANLLCQLEEKEKAHKEQVASLREAMNDRESEWANRNESLQTQLTHTLRSALQENEREDLSLSSLEKEISSLQTVIELRGGENRQLRDENNKLKSRLDNHAWLETELNKAKHRLEELAIIVQNKMVSERELLELSEALQRDLVRSRAETLQLRQQLENKKYTMEKMNMLKVQHSNSDLYNNTVNNNLVNNYDSDSSRRMSVVAEAATATRKLSSLDRIRDWNDLSEAAVTKAINNAAAAAAAAANSDKLDHRNQHQKASSGKPGHPDLVLDVREKSESVSWILQMEPTTTTKSSSPSAVARQKRT